jgi:hypothetical protein
MYQNKNNANTILDLSGLGDLILGFGSNTDESISFEEFPTQSADKARGQVVFRLNETQSTNVLGLKDREFNIYIRNEKGTTAGLTGATSVDITNTAQTNAANARGEKQLLYTGKFYSSAEYAKLAELDKIEELIGTINEKDGQINRQENIIVERNSTVANKDNIIADLQTRLSKANADLVQALKDQATFLASDNIEDAQFKATIDSLTAQLNAATTSINQINTQLQNLTSEKVGLTNENNRLLALISTLNATIASLRATPVRTDVLPYSPIIIRNFGELPLVNPNNPRSLLPPASSIVSVNASNFAVSPVRPSGSSFANNVISVPSFTNFTNVTIPAAFQSTSPSKGSASKGTNVINSIVASNFGGGGRPS